MGEKNPDKKYSGIGILDYSVAAKPGWEETPQQQSAEYQEEAKAQHEQLLEEYQADVKDDEKDQYLVDGALLTCNQATWAPFPVPGEGDIELVFASEEGKYARKYPFPVGELSVQDDEMSVNNELYATVEDAVKNKNISPFRCNCKIEAYTKAEIEAIKNDPFCNIFGVCSHFMRLNDEWDNLPLPGQFYKTKEIVKEKKDGEDIKETIEVPCITMTSALFCKHGGLITPVTSGQNSVSMEEEILQEGITEVSEKLIVLLKSYETGLGKNGEALNEGEPALYPYHGDDDPEGVLTIGWGHAMWNLDDGYYKFSDGTEINLYSMKDESGESINGITEQQAEEILSTDIQAREESLNKTIRDKGIEDMINQQFYDALFLLTYQMGNEYLTGTGSFSMFLTAENFDLSNEQEIMEQFGDFTDNLSEGSMRRRADELDIIFKDDYKRDYDETRYGDIWRKKTYPESVTPGYE